MKIKSAFMRRTISVILSAALTVGMRSRDRNDNSLDKVKRYADKRLGEFDEYFKKQQEHLSVSGNELESKDIEAKAAVKRLEQQIGDLRADASSLQNMMRQLEKNYLKRKNISIKKEKYIHLKNQKKKQSIRNILIKNQLINIENLRKLKKVKKSLKLSVKQKFKKQQRKKSKNQKKRDIKN